MKTQKLIPGLLIAAGFLAYYNIYQAPFIFDDGMQIVSNPLVRQLAAPWEILTHSSRPVVILSLAINYALGGLNPWGYHLFNVIVHILAALTLYGVVRRTLLTRRLRSAWQDAAPWVAGITALLWLVHPLQTESVTYTIQRAESLMGVFYLFTVYCLVRSSESSRGGWWQAGAVAGCALGMACKQVMVTAPLVMLLYDRAFLADSWRETLQRRWGLYLGLAMTWLLLPVEMANGVGETQGLNPNAGFDYRLDTPRVYAQTQPGVILHYLRLSVWPHPLCLDYGWDFGWPLAWKFADGLPGMIAIGALLGLTVYLWTRRPALGFLGAWFFLILGPTSTVMPIADIVVEHRMYLSLAAVIVAAVLAAFLYGGRLFEAREKFKAPVGAAVCLAAAGTLMALTIQRNRDYSSDIAIWQHTVDACPNNPRAHLNLGFALENANEIQGAIWNNEQALRICPEYFEAHNNLGDVLIKAGRYEEALPQLEEAVRLNPNLAEAHNNLAAVLVHQGKMEEAIAQLQAATRLKPNYAVGQKNMAELLLFTGRASEAIEHYEEALRIQPDYAEASAGLQRARAQAAQSSHGPAN